ncbi:glutaredoxin [Listeria booriae]|uniref:Glutaredoxin n=1 Tax=Listeria booriae TaxID=1552123 RepID=A0A7X0ZWW8_9LIST|nr:glutaredoxin [Listeria booriae]MBC1492395.1 glutaredoxin [Listeria booriae]MBC1504222.1 glutaredoxin [Listeria booriae]MBC1525423.1 glutaredoxin [Listeria booriae]MBC1530131.1 glutaredoxin [Listeria booriae]MBC2311420.1 glutaredoxin [Listeria booriae]
MAESLSVIVWTKQGCQYCAEVKAYLGEQGFDFKEVDVTDHDEQREILQAKYGVRYVPVVEIGRGHTYKGVTELGLPALKKALEEAQKWDLDSVF